MNTPGVILATGEHCATLLVDWKAAVDDDAAPRASPPQVYYEQVVVGKSDVHNPIAWLEKIEKQLCSDSCTGSGCSVSSWSMRKSSVAQLPVDKLGMLRDVGHGPNETTVSNGALQ